MAITERVSRRKSVGVWRLQKRNWGRNITTRTTARRRVALTKRSPMRSQKKWPREGKKERRHLKKYKKHLFSFQHRIYLLFTLLWYFTYAIFSLCYENEEETFTHVIDISLVPFFPRNNLQAFNTLLRYFPIWFETHISKSFFESRKIPASKKGERRSMKNLKIKHCGGEKR